jgi:hypothetical protein
MCGGAEKTFPQIQGLSLLKHPEQGEIPIHPLWKHQEGSSL